MSVGSLKRYGLPLANVIGTGTATGQIIPGRTMEKISYRLGGEDFAKGDMGVIKIKANGKAIVDTTAGRMNAINAYRGVTQDAGFLDIQFADNSMATDFDRMVGAFDTSAIVRIDQEIQIDGATNPTLTPILIESALQKDIAGNRAPWAGVIAKYLQYPFSIANGGRLPMNIPFGPNNGAVIKRVHIFHTGHVKGVVVKENSLVIHESEKLENEYEQSRFGRVPQANCYTVDFVLEGLISRALDTRSSKSLEWLIEFDAADSGEVVIEYLDVLPNL